MDKQLLGFETDFTVNTGNRFLVLTKSGLDREQIIGFQVEMITNNEIPGITKLFLREKDGAVELHYNLSGLISIANYLRRQKLSRLEFINILEKLLDVVLESRCYFLNDTSFVLEGSFVFINPKSKDVYLIYLPLDIDEDFTGLFKSLLVNLVENCTGLESSDSDLLQLLDRVQEEEFNLTGFREQLKKIKSTGTHPVITIDEFPNESHGDGDFLPNKSEYRPDEGYTPPTNAKRQVSTTLLVLMATVAILAAVFSNVKGGSLGSMLLANKWYFLQGVGVLLLAGLIVGVLSLFIKANKSGLSSYFAKAKATGQMGTDGIEQETGHGLEFTPIERNDMGIEGNGMESELPEYTCDDTVLLEESNYPCLRAVNDGGTIIISKNEFILGRRKETCDYAIQNISIGRAHAHIIKCAGVYYIEDMDSTNGTFINGSRLLSNKKYELHDSDQITLANVEYRFFIG